MISSLAHIDPTAELADDVEVGPFSYIGPGVQIDSGCKIRSHVVINGPSKFGKNNEFFQFSSVGEDPQDKKFQKEDSYLVVGDNNVFRESTTINRGTAHGGGTTTIGNNNLFMAYVHVAHDCSIGDNTVFSNNASIAGHVNVHDNVILSGFVGVHQFCTIGKHAFLAGGSVVVKDVPPFVTISGYPAKVYGLNTVGLTRNGFTADQIVSLKRAYKVFYRQSLSFEDAVNKLTDMAHSDTNIQTFVDFLVNHKNRGIVR